MMITAYTHVCTHARATHTHTHPHTHTDWIKELIKEMCVYGQLKLFLEHGKCTFEITIGTLNINGI